MPVIEYCPECPYTNYWNRTRMERMYVREYTPGGGRGVDRKRPAQRFKAVGWVCPKEREHIKWDESVGKAIGCERCDHTSKSATEADEHDKTHSEVKT